MVVVTITTESHVRAEPVTVETIAIRVRNWKGGLTPILRGMRIGCIRCVIAPMSGVMIRLLRVLLGF